MPVLVVPVTFPFTDAPTLHFVNHCLTNWNDLSLCSEQQVEYMKHLIRIIFNLPNGTQMYGILFEVRY
jgi:hypothetical protein